MTLPRRFDRPRNRIQLLRGIPLFVLLAGLVGLAELNAEAIDPTQLVFHRIGVRRFIFSNNLPLSELVPSELVALNGMHPSFRPYRDGAPVPDPDARLDVVDGGLVVSGPNEQSAVYVGGVNPFATYEVEVKSVKGSPEVGIELATVGLATRVQVVVCHEAAAKGVVFRMVKNGQITAEEVFADKAPQPPYRLRVQLGGTDLSVFLTQKGATSFLGRTKGNRLKADADLRNREFASNCTFNLIGKSPAGTSATIGGARSYLSAGVGQADIRVITHKDGAPFLENNRIWFTFSARGLGINTSFQGVMSLDPSLFDLRFEGAIVYDHGDGLLRNDYASCVFYDDEAKLWRAIACDFGGAANREGRAGSGLVVASSPHDPRRGFSVMGNAHALAGFESIHEDPCLIFDSEAKKWRLAACHNKGFHTRLYESENWDGPFTSVAGPTAEDSTGVLIQKIGSKRYVFSGNSSGPMLVYSYPGLALLGEMKIDLPAHWPKGPGRGWPNVFALPAGYPSRYMALMMDRPNFPGVTGPNWSYGALYLFSAFTSDISGDSYEYSPQAGSR